MLTAGPRGPQLLQGVWYPEKLAQFDREVIPERRMHAKGSVARGTFTVTHDITQLFFMRDPRKFSDLNHAVKRDPRTNLRSAKNNWDFWAALPEALHQITIMMSDRGIPATYRHMHGFASHTFSLINARNERSGVKFPFKSHQGMRNLSDAEAEALVGQDRESHQGDLYDSIERGEFPR